MRMLPSGVSDEEEREVNAADQEQINRFSKLNRRLDDILDLIQAKKEEKEALDDLVTELELEDEDTLLPYQLQAAFLHLPVRTILELTADSTAKLDGTLAELDTEADGCREGMEALKLQLYGKFGKAINLERGD